MKNKEIKIIVVAFLVGVISLFGINFIKDNYSQISSRISQTQNVAQVSDYQPISGVDLQNNDNGPGLAGLFNTIFQWAVGIAILLSVLFIVLGAIQYMTSGDNQQSTGEAKAKIQGAIGGLILALISYLILNTINPNLTKINIDPKSLDVGGDQKGLEEIRQGVDGQFKDREIRKENNGQPSNRG